MCLVGGGGEVCVCVCVWGEDVLYGSHMNYHPLLAWHVCGRAPSRMCVMYHTPVHTYISMHS